MLLRLVPEIVASPLWPTRLLPKEIGPIANELVQTLLGFRQHAMGISKWVCWLSAVVHPVAHDCGKVLLETPPPLLFSFLDADLGDSRWALHATRRR